MSSCPFGTFSSTTTALPVRRMRSADMVPWMFTSMGKYSSSLKRSSNQYSSAALVRGPSYPSALNWVAFRDTVSLPSPSVVRVMSLLPGIKLLPEPMSTLFPLLVWQ